jgi:hypothetical protein
MSYLPYTDSGGYPTGAYPQVGDVYYMAVDLTIIGNPGGGGDSAIVQIQLPANTQLAISSANPTICRFYDSGGTELKPNPTCPTPSVGGVLPISLGLAPIASYYGFEEDFPVKTTAPLNGLCTQTPPNGTSIPGTVSSACVLNYNDWTIGRWNSNTEEFVYEGIYVPALSLNTTIGSKPAPSTTSTAAGFSFSSTPSGASFECKLDSGSWAACGSPKSYSGLSVGGHKFQVRAKQAINYVDISQTRVESTPASYTWTITSTGGGGSGGGTAKLAFSAAKYSVKASVTSATITIKRTGTTSSAVTVVFKTANGTAKAPANYTAVSKTVSFAKGVTTEKVSVPIKKGSVKKGSKTVKLSLSKPGSGAALGAPAAATLTIVG